MQAAVVTGAHCSYPPFASQVNGFSYDMHITNQPFGPPVGNLPASSVLCGTEIVLAGKTLAGSRLWASLATLGSRLSRASA